DPDALAKLMKSVPLSRDGKFLLLESETADAVNGEEDDDLESEA
ncbi:DCC-interacting protein 13-beta isoform X1, partial [Tachysurus ichikawai]